MKKIEWMLWKKWDQVQFPPHARDGIYIAKAGPLEEEMFRLS